jgi:hypothetical protein
MLVWWVFQLRQCVPRRIKVEQSARSVPSSGFCSGTSNSILLFWPLSSFGVDLGET